METAAARYIIKNDPDPETVLTVDFNGNDLYIRSDRRREVAALD